MSGAKKIYFCDNGIINLFGKVSAGALLENAIFMNLRQKGKLHYYQRRSGVEIDFILPEQSTAIEVKKRALPQDIRKLKKLSHSLNFEHYYVISQEFTDEPHCIIAADL